MAKRNINTMMHECVALYYGEWTRTAPTSPGVYRVADVHRNELLAPVELRIVSGQLVSYKNGQYVPAKKAWRGWWWSRPNPNLPRAG